jgi:hypothetical protein
MKFRICVKCGHRGPLEVQNCARCNHAHRDDGSYCEQTNNVISHFPQDWIRPGEFCYCSAGEHLVPQYGDPCLLCFNSPQPTQLNTVLEAHGLRSWPGDWLVQRLVDLYDTAYQICCSQSNVLGRAKSMSETLHKHRLSIAQARKDAGMPRLFWMSK